MSIIHVFGDLGSLRKGQRGNLVIQKPSAHTFRIQKENNLRIQWEHKWQRWETQYWECNDNSARYLYHSDTLRRQKYHHVPTKSIWPLNILQISAHQEPQGILEEYFEFEEQIPEKGICQTFQNSFLLINYALSCSVGSVFETFFIFQVFDIYGALGCKFRVIAYFPFDGTQGGRWGMTKEWQMM